MSASDENNHTAAEFFDKHIRFERALDDINTLDALLPTDGAVLRRLVLRCSGESRKAMRAGRHTESRRLELLSPAIAKTLREGFFAVW
jgi:hypothetical protein